MFVGYCRVRFETKPYNNHNETIIDSGAILRRYFFAFLLPCGRFLVQTQNFASQSIQCKAFQSVPIIANGATHCAATIILYNRAMARLYKKPETQKQRSHSNLQIFKSSNPRILKPLNIAPETQKRRRH